jgi:hypothetical protein
VWVVTDGGIESTLQAMALGKQIAGSNTLSNTFKLKTIVASKRKLSTQTKKDREKRLNLYYVIRATNISCHFTKISG